MSFSRLVLALFACAAIGCTAPETGTVPSADVIQTSTPNVPVEHVPAPYCRENCCAAPSDCADGQGCFDHMCGVCTSDEQCAAGRCLPSGRCAPASSVVQVSHVAGCGTMGASSFCEIDAAIAGRSQVVVQLVASDVPYASFVPTRQPGAVDIAIIGPGAAQASISSMGGSAGAAAIDMDASEGEAHLDVRNVSIALPGVADGYAVRCRGGHAGTLQLRDVTIENGAAFGVDSDCDLTIERSIVRNNGVGLELGGSFTVRSSFIVGNDNGVVLDSNAGTLAHLTIAGNTYGAIVCAGGEATLGDSIVVGSAGSADAHCAYSNTVNGAATLAAACTPAFSNATTGDYHLDVSSDAAKAANRECVIDRGGVDLALIDIDGQHMLGLATDLGGDEAL